MGVSLEVLSGPHRGRRFEFTQHDTFLVGRAADCHCSLPDDPFVSRRHFILEVNPPVCVLRDLLSRNGVVLNGRRLSWPEERGHGSSERPAPVRFLKHGDRLTVGKTVLEVVVGARAVCCHCGRDCEPEEQTRGEWRPVGFTCIRCRPADPGRAALLESHSTEESLLGCGTQTDSEPNVFPGYEIVRILGGHACSRVYLVRHRNTGREMALKALRPARGEGPELEQARTRFQREMEICMTLRHPGIVHFVEQGRADPDLYFVMEHCTEGSVADLMASRGGRLEVGESVALVGQVLDALEYAHGMGLVHRDVKPSNILLVPDGDFYRARLSDFGLAKNFQVAGLSGVTITSYFSGSWPFMPREQVLAFKHLRPVSDLFSTAATLYNMITGRYAYGFTEGCDYVRAVLDGGVVPIRTRNPEIPEALAQVVDKAVSPKPEDRYQTARELRDALREATR